MKILGRIKQLVLNKIYLGKTERTTLRNKPTYDSFKGWKKEGVAKRMLMITKNDIEQVKKGIVDNNIKTTMELIDSTGLNKFHYLDVGCGTGTYSEIIKILRPELKVEYTGIDYSKDLIEIANKTFENNGKFISADMQKLPFKNKSFDISCMSSVLPYSPDYNKAISELKRVSKKYVMITRITVTRGKESYQKQKAYGSEWTCILFNENKLKLVFEKNGLSVIKEINLSHSNGETFEKSYLLRVRK